MRLQELKIREVKRNIKEGYFISLEFDVERNVFATLYTDTYTNEIKVAVVNHNTNKREVIKYSKEEFMATYKADLFEAIKGAVEKTNGEQMVDNVETNDVIKFAVGKEYYAVEDGSNDTTMKVLRRTPSYIIIQNEYHEEQRVKIQEFNGVEYLDASTQLFYKAHLYRADMPVKSASKGDKLRALCKLIKEGNATLDEQIEYYTILSNVSCGKLKATSIFMRNRLLVQQVYEERKAKAQEQQEQQKVEEVKETKETKEIPPVSTHEFGGKIAREKWMEVYKAKIQKGDIIRITFEDCNTSLVKVTGGRFGNYYVRNKHDYDLFMFLDYKKYNDGLKSFVDEFECNIEKVSKIEILERSKFAKKHIFESNKAIKTKMYSWFGVPLNGR